MAQAVTRRARPSVAFTFDVDRALELTGHGARILLALFIVTQVTLAIVDGGAPMRSWRGYLALALVIATAVLVVTPGAYPMRTSWTIGVVGAVGVNTALMNWSLDTHSWPGYSSWHFGANTFLLMAVALRGRAWWAWAGMGLMAALTVAWSMTTGQGVGYSVDLLDRQAGTLLMGTLFAVGLSRTMRRLQQVTESQNVRAAEDVAALAALRVRDERLAWLEQTAAPALRAIVDGSAFGGGAGGAGGAAGAGADAGSGADPRAELLITEGMLRDSIRGGILANEPMVSSTAQARRRGVDVVLLDDSGGAVPRSDVAESVAWAAERLDAVPTGAVTVRVSATDSAVIVSVVGDELGQQTRQMAADGRTQSRALVSTESAAAVAPR